MRFAIWLAFFLLALVLATDAQAGIFGRRSGGAAMCMDGSCGVTQAPQKAEVYRTRYGDEVFLGRTRFFDGDGRPFRKAR